MIKCITPCQSKKNRMCYHACVTKRLFLKIVHKNRTFKHDKCFAISFSTDMPEVDHNAQFHFHLFEIKGSGFSAWKITYIWLCEIENNETNLIEMAKEADKKNSINVWGLQPFSSLFIFYLFFIFMLLNFETQSGVI